MDNQAPAGLGTRWKSPLAPFVLSQITAALFLFAILFIHGRATGQGLTTPLWQICLLQGMIACLFSCFAKARGLSLVFHLLLPFAIWLGLVLPVPSWVYLLIAAIIGLVYRNVLKDRVPLYLTNRTTWQALADLLPDGEGHFCDLGSGLAGTLAYLGGKRPDSQFTGIESAPLPCLISKCRLFLLGLGNVKIIYGDIWKENLSRYDLVYCFLSPVPMPEIYKKARAEMKPGSLLISNSFDVPGHPADEILELDDRRKTRLHLWRL